MKPGLPVSAAMLEQLCTSAGIDVKSLGVIVVDHGSRREASNDALLDVVRQFEQATPFTLVEPAHMELAEPTIEMAFDRLVAAGAQVVVVHPYFLLPGRHSTSDIPELTAQAAQKHPETQYVVTQPLGIHPLMTSIMSDRIVAQIQALGNLASNERAGPGEASQREREKS